MRANDFRTLLFMSNSFILKELRNFMLLYVPGFTRQMLPPVGKNCRVDSIEARRGGIKLLISEGFTGKCFDRFGGNDVL
jgi:hypothetical protein